ncbi:MAG TPA: Hg(II)-responsive transcriptional regulator [Ramlibacter sp.]|nr:Hg(II)-responsive transcriptional regulator [Ramlibacter sp.]
MEQGSARLAIGAFAAAAGVNVETVRYYQRKGLLGEPDKPYGSIRRYGEHDVARVAFIKSAQRLGFSLDEVAALLSLDDGMHCKQAQVLAEHKLDSVRARLTDLRRIEVVLEGLVRQCVRSPGRVSCPLVAALHGCRPQA